MKQKMVIRVQMEDAKKRSKALKQAVALPGVISAAIEGPDKNKIVVVGDGVDSITLTMQLRKNMGFAELISVEEKKEENKEKNKPVEVWSPYVRGYPEQHYYVVEAPNPYQNPNCCVL